MGEIKLTKQISIVALNAQSLPLRKKMATKSTKQTVNFKFCELRALQPCATMASSTLFHIHFTFVFFWLASSFSKAAYSNKKSNEPNFNCIFVKATSRKAHKRLILFPKTSITIASADDHTLVSALKLVEKQYPGTSVQEFGFGHHAGYYELPHSQSAR